ncbi:RagB/SusD family nutrient uptake outer membrane protein [Parachryseolinea silvisoli]|uniref:RagB/SusD family nutrient uptake outer membrane protein n=1 Tax=Parachryseolinea silvisoli TaxID=2873601 RepID=UPI0022658747|nr:RagB/SusD family nutrient uptake outer membrane protein [Parachryseolinea silvisoli]MCD9018883.1 RagB/SusD family nutrient uptake outer membrane protein [Parachryseolinea silvisoli]
MKKNIKLKLLYLTMTILVMACDDFLEKNPLTQLDSDTFWKTEQDVQAALTATYSTHRTSIFGSVRGSNGVAMDIEALSDNAITSSNFVNYVGMMQGGINPSSTGALNQTWSDCYDGIAKCNYFLDNIDGAKSLLTEANYNKYKGEALFNRCYYYNELVQRYGAVPLILYTQTIDSVNLVKTRPRSPKADVVARLLQDIDVAIAVLPADRYTDGHAVKGSAIMLKVRILMNNQRFAEAADVAWSLIGDAANPYSLYRNYSGLFFKEQRAADNKEIMFSVIYQAPADYHQLDQYVGSRMSCFPTPQLRDAYETNIDTGLKDPRLGMTIFQLGDQWVNNTKTGTFQQDGSVAESTLPFTNMAFKKWIDPTVRTPGSSTLSDQNIVKMRYADLLLLYAEAMFESGQGTDTRALKALNDVRTRPGVNMPLKTELTRDNIRNERRVELAYEGIRYNDIIRWGIAETVIPQIIHSTKGDKRKFDGYLWPIPQSQIDIMQGVWENNEPWN